MMASKLTKCLIKPQVITISRPLVARSFFHSQSREIIHSTRMSGATSLPLKSQFCQSIHHGPQFGWTMSMHETPADDVKFIIDQLDELQNEIKSLKDSITIINEKISVNKTRSENEKQSKILNNPNLINFRKRLSETGEIAVAAIGDFGVDMLSLVGFAIGSIIVAVILGSAVLVFFPIMEYISGRIDNISKKLKNEEEKKPITN